MYTSIGSKSHKIQRSWCLDTYKIMLAKKNICHIFILLILKNLFLITLWCSPENGALGDRSNCRPRVLLYKIVNRQIKWSESINLTALIRKKYLKHGFQNVKREIVAKKSNCYYWMKREIYFTILRWIEQYRSYLI